MGEETCNTIFWLSVCVGGGDYLLYGNFNNNAAEDTVPRSLLALVIGVTVSGAAPIAIDVIIKQSIISYNYSYPMHRVVWLPSAST